MPALSDEDLRVVLGPFNVVISILFDTVLEQVVKLDSNHP